VVARLKERLQEMPPVTALLADGQKPEVILDEVFSGIKHKLLSKYPLRFECDCSRERTESALVSLGREELQALLDHEGQASVTCQYCRTEYVFSGEELEALIAAL
jgi:molecular chaperone Hsp33